MLLPPFANQQVVTKADGTGVLWRQLSDHLFLPDTLLTTQDLPKEQLSTASLTTAFTFSEGPEMLNNVRASKDQGAVGELETAHESALKRRGMKPRPGGGGSFTRVLSVRGHGRVSEGVFWVVVHMCILGIVCLLEGEGVYLRTPVIMAYMSYGLPSTALIYALLC